MFDYPYCATLEARKRSSIGKFGPVRVDFTLRTAEPINPTARNLRDAAIIAADGFGFETNHVAKVDAGHQLEGGAREDF